MPMNGGIVNLVTVFVLLGTLVICLFATLSLCRHRHTWLVRAVDHGVMSEPRRNATAILYVCSSCGEAKSTTVAGTYQLEDINCALISSCGAPTADGRHGICWSPSDKLFARRLKVKL